RDLNIQSEAYGQSDNSPQGGMSRAGVRFQFCRMGWRACGARPPFAPLSGTIRDRRRAGQLRVLARQLRLPEAGVDRGEQVVHLQVEDEAGRVPEAQGTLRVPPGRAVFLEGQAQLAAPAVN